MKIVNAFPLLTMAVVLAATLLTAVRAEGTPAQKNVPTSRAQQLMGDVAPKMAQLTDDVLYGDIWERPQLSKRDRSLVTVSALIAMDRPDQLRSHIRLALKNGVTQQEIIKTITQLAFYSGWPTAVSAVGIAKEVFKESGSSEQKNR
ncbi:MAG: hypothetical protein XXXJIFNMEKO3_01384 [Candidatus Erwinia impunctatus]|nr:hypothetical protein XXXJIFNMEKO_01384 [Culicoides impunctatus]